ncbi:hypothetical protein CEXT_586711 [Caerostris extrusa]|uniref:Uncharacterized protein n=1 Tax=Caerostris extrusa TaxID=172846 RepID=A0AAV4QPX5_CAEEX|nr:hypothetical protein CEXT_586711 [Caerostris extrusa]
MKDDEFGKIKLTSLHSPIGFKDTGLAQPCISQVLKNTQVDKTCLSKSVKLIMKDDEFGKIKLTSLHSPIGFKDTGLAQPCISQVLKNTQVDKTCLSKSVKLIMKDDEFGKIKLTSLHSPIGFKDTGLAQPCISQVLKNTQVDKTCLSKSIKLIMKMMNLEKLNLKTDMDKKMVNK